MLKRLRDRLPQDSLFRKPLVFEISLVLVVKVILIVILWQFAFKPLKPAVVPDIHVKMGLPNHSPKDVTL